MIKLNIKVLVPTGKSWYSACLPMQHINRLKENRRVEIKNLYKKKQSHLRFFHYPKTISAVTEKLIYVPYLPEAFVDATKAMDQAFDFKLYGKTKLEFWISAV